MDEAPLVESTGRKKDVASERAEAGPERARRARSQVVYVVVQQVPETRYETIASRIVVVRAEDPGQARTVCEGLPDLDESISMHLDVGIDEYENFRRRLRGTPIARSRWPKTRRPVNNDDFLRRLLRLADRPDAPR